jgi:ribonuclease PH
MSRNDSRTPADLRPLKFTRKFTNHPAGSVLVEAGQTRVLCTVTVTESVPRWRQSSGKGWLTAEYAMLPGSVVGRKKREHDRALFPECYPTGRLRCFASRWRY